MWEGPHKKLSFSTLSQVVLSPVNLNRSKKCKMIQRETVVQFKLGGKTKQKLILFFLYVLIGGDRLCCRPINNKLAAVDSRLIF